MYRSSENCEKYTGYILDIIIIIINIILRVPDIACVGGDGGATGGGGDDACR